MDKKVCAPESSAVLAANNFWTVYFNRSGAPRACWACVSTISCQEPRIRSSLCLYFPFSFSSSPLFFSSPVPWVVRGPKRADPETPPTLISGLPQSVEFSLIVWLAGRGWKTNSRRIDGLGVFPRNGGICTCSSFLIEGWVRFPVVCHERLIE